MSNNIYAAALQKAKASLEEKRFTKEPVCFEDIRVSDANTKIFWFIFRAIGKIKRELKK